MDAAGSGRTPRSREGNSLVGTASYASINGHKGKELCKRDDLESLCYVLAYLSCGELPWQVHVAGLRRNNRESLK